MAKHIIVHLGVSENPTPSSRPATLTVLKSGRLVNLAEIVCSTTNNIYFTGDPSGIKVSPEELKELAEIIRSMGQPS